MYVSVTRFIKSQPQGQEEYNSTNHAKEGNAAANVRDVVQRRLGRERERGITQITPYCIYIQIFVKCRIEKVT